MTAQFPELTGETLRDTNPDLSDLQEQGRPVFSAHPTS